MLQYNGVDDLESPSCFPVHVIASTEVILPGEETTLVLSDEEAIPLIQTVCDQNCRSIAVAVKLEDYSIHFEEDWTVAQVASKCEIVGVTAETQDRVTVSIRCVGRIRLERMLQRYTSTHFQFSGEPVLELLDGQEDRDKAKLIEENIDSLFWHASIQEKEISSQERETSSAARPRQQSTGSLHQEYIETRQSVLQAITADMSHQSSVGQGISDSSVTNKGGQLEPQLAATSWAVFLCLSDPKLEARYRLRALDWDNMLERLKLAQYALREKNLLLQGKLVTMKATLESDHPPAMEDNAFQ